MEDVSHKEIYDRLIQVEQKVDKIDSNTKAMVTAFNAASGAFTVLEWLAKAVKLDTGMAGGGGAARFSTSMPT